MMLVLDFWVCSIGIDEAWREKKKRTEKRMLLLSLGKVIISELCIVCLTLPFVCLQNGSLFPLVLPLRVYAERVFLKRVKAKTGPNRIYGLSRYDKFNPPGTICNVRLFYTKKYNFIYKPG